MSDRDTMRALCAQKAQQLWDGFDENQRAGVRFGMFPAEPMQAAMKEALDSRMLCVALMDVASKNGGMRA
jgi:hypothetical protein